MKTRIVVTVASLVIGCIFGTAFGQDVPRVPEVINYQGRLTDAGGASLAGESGGTFRLRFEIFAQATGGAAGWAEERDAVVIGGIFNVALGGAGGAAVGEVPNDLGAAFAEPLRFLQSTIVSGPTIAAPQTLAPRQQLMSVPFALTAEEAGNAENSANLNGKPGSFWMPSGGMIAYGGTTDPAGWLICDGRALSRTGIYSELFTAIGTTFGAGNGSTTFNIPDSRGLILRASGSQILNGSAKVGPAVGSKQEDQFQGHKHFLSYVNEPTIAGIQGSTGGGSANVTWQQANNANTNLLEVGNPRNDGLHGAPRIGSETRASSLGVNYIIKY
jgi:microcystin-dependent protein